MRAYPIQSYRVHARSNQSDSSRIRRQRPIAIAADNSIDDREVAAWLGLPHRSVGGYGIALIRHLLDKSVTRPHQIQKAGLFAGRTSRIKAACRL